MCEFLDEQLSVLVRKLFYQACREEVSTKLSLLKGHIKTKKHADGIKRSCQEGMRERLCTGPLLPIICCFITLYHKKCLRIIAKRFGNNWGYFGEILERIIGNCMRIIGSSLALSSMLCYSSHKSH